MPLYVGKYVICAFLQNMQNMLRSHDRYKPVSLPIVKIAWLERFHLKINRVQNCAGSHVYSLNTFGT